MEQSSGRQVDRQRFYSWITMGIVLFYFIQLALGAPQSSPPEYHPFGIKIRTGANLRSYREADELVQIMAENRVNLAFLLVKSDEEEPELPSGYLFYPGKTAPVAPGFEEDILGYFIRKAQEKQIRIIAWLPVMKDAAFWESHPSARAQVVRADGTVSELENWLSPFAPATLEHAQAVLQEVLSRYPFDGVVLDYIRYDDDFATVDQHALAAYQRRYDRTLRVDRLHQEARKHSRIWKKWVRLRAQQIAEVSRQLLETAKALRPDIEFGLTLLPFSAGDYFKNTVSGQDYRLLSKIGVDFISPLGYWDDWYKEPDWVRQVYREALKNVDGRCQVIMAVDGDMPFHSTAATWKVLPDDHQPIFFYYGKWTRERLVMLRLARRAVVQQSEQLVAIRIDTEPDYSGNWNVPDGDFLRLLDVFEANGISVTWVTVGRFAETRPELLKLLYLKGHEIALHGWAHERFEDLPNRQEKENRIRRGINAMKKIGIPIWGFGAPQNSIDSETRDILLELGFLYDASLALDPAAGQWLSVQHFSDSRGTLLVIPYVYPNDYDGLYTMQLDARGLFREWKKRFDENYRTARTPFVIDVHQWLIGQPQYLDALKQFIQYVQKQPNVRFVTLKQIADIYRTDPLPTALPVSEPPTTKSSLDIPGDLWTGFLRFIAFFPGILALQYIIFALLYRWIIERKAPFNSEFTPSVAVLVPAHNEAAHIQSTLKALLASDYPNMEIIVIDDGSTDGTAELAARMPGVKVLRLLENRGKAHALNQALRWTAADIVVCVDADTRVEPMTIRYLVQRFRDPTVAGVTGNPQIRDRRGFLRKLQTMEYATIISLIKRAEALLGGLYTVSGAICAFRRSVLVQNGGWNETTQTEDIEISWRLQKLGYRMTYEPRAVCWISVPGKYSGLLRQRIRWSRGSGEAYRKHLKIVTSPNTATVPIIFNGMMSSLWAISLLVVFPVLTLHVLPGLRNGSEILLASIGLLHLQSAIGLILDRPYNPRLPRYFLMTPFFILYFWLLVLPAFVYGFGRGLLGEQSGVWQIQRA
ncbi:MAG: glycosyltransferase [Calditrichaeota bacterium]|nr:glycosyltransferase [Calditrichota bacterium]